MSQIVNMILDEMVDHLKATMQTAVTDETKALTVKKGLLQVDKLQQMLLIGVSAGDHEDPNKEDGIIDLEKMPDIAMSFPAREIGGGEVWIRHFTTRLEIYMILNPKGEKDAHALAYEVLGRLESNIKNLNLSGLVDDYGEIPYGHPFLYANTFFESGGPPNTYIFRGNVKWQVFTERP